MNAKILSNLNKVQISNFNFIVIDTCSLLNDYACEFLECLVFECARNENPFCKIVILESVISELESVSSKKEDLKKNVEQIMDLISNEYKDYIEVVGNKNIQFGDMSIYRTIVGFRTIGKVALITEDKNLTHDCFLLNELKSQKGYKVHVFSIDKLRK